MRRTRTQRLLILAIAAAGALAVSAGAAEHVASSGEKKPVSLKKGPEASAACLTCHEGKPNQAHWQGSAHERAGLACASCHDPHVDHVGTPELPKALPGATKTTKKCLECHGGQRVALNQRSSHPLRDGPMDCASCHNAHGSAGEKLLKQATVNELCTSCHQNMRGPFFVGALPRPRGLPHVPQAARVELPVRTALPAIGRER